MASPRTLLEQLALAPSKARGQNFLSDPGLIAKLVGLIRERLAPGQTLLEIGPGLGALTGPLLTAGVQVLAVEYDRGLAAYLEEQMVPRFPALTVQAQDILTVDLRAVAEAAGGPVVVAGNLPYNLTSPILFWLLAQRAWVSQAVFMMQKEVAQRLTASPGGKDYGRLSLALALTCQKITTLMAAPPGAFHPRPKVESTVVGLDFRPLPHPDLDLGALGRLSQAAFAARRKTLINNLGPVYGREKVLAALAALAIDPGRRPETVSPEDFYTLGKMLAEGQ